MTVKALQRCLIGYVGGVRMNIAMTCGACIKLRLATPADCDVSARSRQRQCDRSTDPGAAAGDECVLTGKIICGGACHFRLDPAVARPCPTIDRAGRVRHSKAAATTPPDPRAVLPHEASNTDWPDAAGRGRRDRHGQPLESN